MAVRRPWGGDHGLYSDGADDDDDVLTGAPRRMRFDDGEDEDVPHMGTWRRGEVQPMHPTIDADVEYTLDRGRFMGHVPLRERVMIDRALSGEVSLWYATTTPAALHNGISVHLYDRAKFRTYMTTEPNAPRFPKLDSAYTPDSEMAYDLITFARLVAGVAGEAVVHTVTLMYRVALIGRMPPRSRLFFVFAAEEEARLERYARATAAAERQSVCQSFAAQTTADPPLVNYLVANEKTQINRDASPPPEDPSIVATAARAAATTGAAVATAVAATANAARSPFAAAARLFLAVARRARAPAVPSAQSAAPVAAPQPAAAAAGTSNAAQAASSASTVPEQATRAEEPDDNPAQCPYIFADDTEQQDTCIGLWYVPSRDKYKETSVRRVLLASDIGRMVAEKGDKKDEDVRLPDPDALNLFDRLLPVFIRCHVTFPPRFLSALRMAMDMSADGLCDQARRLLDRETKPAYGRDCARYIAFGKHDSVRDALVHATAYIYAEQAVQSQKAYYSQHQSRINAGHLNSAIMRVRRSLCTAARCGCLEGAGGVARMVNTYWRAGR